MQPLPPVDHSTIVYLPFRKSFYRPHPDILGMSVGDVRRARDAIEISVQAPFLSSQDNNNNNNNNNKDGGYADNCPGPVSEFYQSGLQTDLLNAIKARGFEKPTAIQAQALPVALSGSDIIGLAKTGSGKTFSFIW